MKARKIYNASSSLPFLNRCNHDATTVRLLEARVQRGMVLPKVEVVGGGEKMDGVVGPVVEHVLRAMNVELFVELMGMMGKTGYRSDDCRRGAVLLAAASE